MVTVDRLEVPTPFDVGTVNCYILEGDVLTLVDPGPYTDDAFQAVQDGLAARGYDVEDVDRVLVTHPHMDHFGLANRLKERAGATVVAHEDGVGIMADPVGHFENENGFFTPFLVSMGVPETTADVVTVVPEPFLKFQQPVTIDRTVEDGDVVDIGEGMETIYTPGHVPGCACFRLRDDESLFTGDHLLLEITPNPVMTVKPDAPSERTRNLPTQLASLEKLLDVDARRGYGGHGPPIDDVHGRIRENIAHHDERKDVIRAVIDEEAPIHAYDIMKEIFPNLPTTEVFLGMSEVIGHLDLLEDEGTVETSSEDRVIMYRIADDGGT